MPLPDLIEIVPLDKPVRAEITVPGSKSITNRALVLAALADGETTLTGQKVIELAGDAAEGVRAADARLVEMSSLFRVPSREVFLKLRLPAAAPHLIAGAKNALGLTWKVVVAGEILSQPRAALGTGMQESRVLLESAGVFAWAVAAIALCGLTEWLLGMAADKAAARGL